MYGSVNCDRIASGNGLSPVRRQAITWANAALLSIGPLGINLREIRIEMKKKIVIHENAFETVVCEMDAILSMGRCVNVYARVYTTSTRQVLGPYAYNGSDITVVANALIKTVIGYQRARFLPQSR